MSAQMTRRPFTVNDFDRMAKAGIFAPDERVELIDGEIVQMAKIGSHHAACVARLVTFFIRNLGDAVCVSPQNPLTLDMKSEPVPDVVVAKPRADFYAEAHPRPEDVLLVIEVSDTTLAFDRKVKVPLYARTGIPEVWVVNLKRGIVEAYTRPEGDGYSEIKKVERGQSLTPLLLPSLSLGAEDILG